MGGLVVGAAGWVRRGWVRRVGASVVALGVAAPRSEVDDPTRCRVAVTRDTPRWQLHKQRILFNVRRVDRRKSDLLEGVVWCRPTRRTDEAPATRANAADDSIGLEPLLLMRPPYNNNRS